MDNYEHCESSGRGTSYEGYTQMAHTVESVLDRQMKKPFPDNQRHPSKADDIHRSYQDHTMPDHPIADPAMFTRHSGMMPMSNRMMPGAMPYPGQLQSLYPPQMYPDDPAFAWFNMNESARGGGAPVFPAMMGMPQPSMTMNTRAPAQFPAHEMQTAHAASTGIAPIATKGYTQMAQTVESVLGRQMEKHFPDDHRHPSKAVDIHRSYQDHTMPDHQMPMSNRMMPGAMPYPCELQSLYRPQMYPGDPAFARFNMNESARGGGAPMFPAVMGMPYPRMTMNTRAPVQFPVQRMQTADAAARGIAPVATKAGSSNVDTYEHGESSKRGTSHRERAWQGETILEDDETYSFNDERAWQGETILEDDETYSFNDANTETTSHSMRPPSISDRLSIIDLKDLNPPLMPAQLPVDVLLLAVEDRELLSCFSFLNNPFKSPIDKLGIVYFGEIGCYRISLMRCRRGSAGVQAAQNVTIAAIKVLTPKAVFSVGCCGSLKKDEAKLGDVVISSRLSVLGELKFIDDELQYDSRRLDVTKNIGYLITSAADGWQAPIKDAIEVDIKVHCGAEILSGKQLVNSPMACKELLFDFPAAIAIESEGQGVYSAAFDNQLEWVVIKGISYYAVEEQTQTEEWLRFSSIMAASVVKHILSQPDVLKDWPRNEN